MQQSFIGSSAMSELFKYSTLFGINFSQTVPSSCLLSFLSSHILSLLFTCHSLLVQDVSINFQVFNQPLSLKTVYSSQQGNIMGNFPLSLSV